jgi:S-adenosylmethionine/arginine decarboxylase-like enzyme
MANGYVAPENRKWMNTPEGISEFLGLVAEWSKMEVVTTQSINIDDPKDGEWYGLSGLAMIKTSHIAFHIWPHYESYYMFDLSSCKEFDPDELSKHIQDHLGEPIEWKHFTKYTPLKYVEP